MSTKAELARRLQQNTQKHQHTQKEQFTHSKEIRRNIKISDIKTSPNQPRKIFHDDELQGLADSIAEIGLLQPISVRYTAHGYELIAGERRLKAHQLIGKSTIEVLVLDVSDHDAALLTLAENLKREDLTDYEIFVGLRALDETIKKNKTKLSKSLGMNREDMYKYLSFEKIPHRFHKDLDAQPSLIGRTVATAIKKYLADYNQSEQSIIALDHAWKKLKDKKIEQMKLISYAKRLIVDNNPLNDIKPSIRKIVHDGRVFGEITVSQQNLKVNLNVEKIDEVKLEQLEDILLDLLK